MNLRLHNIAATGTLTVGGVGANCKVYSINVNTPLASAVATCYDGTAATGRKIATIDCAAAKCIVLGGAVCKDGFTLVLSGANADITVSAG